MANKYLILVLSFNAIISIADSLDRRDFTSLGIKASDSKTLDIGVII